MALAAVAEKEANTILANLEDGRNAGTLRFGFFFLTIRENERRRFVRRKEVKNSQRRRKAKAAGGVRVNYDLISFFVAQKEREKSLRQIG